MKTQSSYNKILSILQELKSLFPNYNMGRHLATALDEYGDVWGVTDKEMVFALLKYKSQLEMDVPHAEDPEEIYKDGLDLDNILKGEENGDS